MNNKIEFGFKLFTWYMLVAFVYQFKSIIKKGVQRNFVVRYTDILFLITGFLFSFINFKVCVKLVKTKLRKYIKTNLRTGEKLDDKYSRVGNYLSGSIFYSLTTFYLFYHFYSSSLRPKIYGGILDFKKINMNVPKRLSREADFIYLFHLGHHIFRTLKHYMHYKKSSTLYQTMGHHLLTIYLIFLSYILGYCEWGIVYFILFDITDIPVNTT